MMMFILVLLIAAVSAATNMMGKNGYALNCRHAALLVYNQHTGLRAECDAPGNTTQCSILDLNFCFEWNPTIVQADPGPNGGFNRWENPSTCAFERNNTTMTCQILRDPHHRDWFWLNHTIKNDGGRLRCFDKIADTPPDCANRTILRDGDKVSETGALVAPFTTISAIALLVVAFILQ